MNSEVEKYFKEKYSKADFRVVPGHWPDFKTKEDVDYWIMIMELMNKQFNDYFGDDEDE